MMSHTELYFMIQNYVLFFMVGLLAVKYLMIAVIMIIAKWRGNKK